MYLPENMGAESWKALNKVAKRGNLDRIIVKKLRLGVTYEEIETICTVLGFVEHWESCKLSLPGNMGADSWEALSMVVDKGKVDNVDVNMLALKAANNQQITKLWQATKVCWEDSSQVLKISMQFNSSTGKLEIFSLKTK